MKLDVYWESKTFISFVLPQSFGNSLTFFSGATSDVFLGKEKTTQQEYAIKQVSLHAIKKQKALLREIYILKVHFNAFISLPTKRLSHPNIIRLERTIRTRENIYMILEL